MSVIALCWATKKRHIAKDDVVLCEPKHKNAGYSVKNGQYNTLSLSGIPTHRKNTSDSKYCHADGIIEFKPLDEQIVEINTKSICVKCLRKYNALLEDFTRREWNTYLNPDNFDDED